MDRLTDSDLAFRRSSKFPRRAIRFGTRHRLYFIKNGKYAIAQIAYSNVPLFFLKFFFLNKEMCEGGLSEPTDVALCDTTLKCCVGWYIFVCVWSRKKQQDASEYKILHFTVLQTDRLQATAFYHSLLHNRYTYCGVSIRRRNYLRDYTAQSLCV